MRYQITGKQIDIGEALQTHVKAELGEVVEKYAQRPTDASIVFSKAGHEFFCEATIHLSTGLSASAKGHATEIYAAFESCREKMDKQMRRYKRRLRSHHRDRAEPVEYDTGSSYILAAADEVEDNDASTLCDCRDGDEDPRDHRRRSGHAAGAGGSEDAGLPQRGPWRRERGLQAGRWQHRLD